MALPTLMLKNREDRRLRAGHLWVFSNEVDTVRTPLTRFAPGEAVEVRAHDGRFLGSGYVNPNSLICARLLSLDAERAFDAELFGQRLDSALALREHLYTRPFYRLIFGESDRLSGLVVDRYGDWLVGQITTAGMERCKDMLVTVLGERLRPAGILWRNDVAIRNLEGLPLYVETASGSIPEAVVIEEHGLKFEVPLAGGQKTGWFFDQRDNRARLARYVRGRRVLDAFSYVGAWSVQALAQGAQKTLCVDASGAALTRASANAALNGFELEVRQADAFDALRDLHAAGEKFEVVILDPPAFVKRKKDLAAGREAYRRLNQLGLQLLGADGLLVSCSCSFHMPESELLATVQSAARRLGYELQLLERGGQSADHPVHPAIPETGYLKAFFLRVVQ
ncbi:MAG: class I SAM-dependent rRNA methyltransferase [Gammaproteobacteria bacterium]